MTDYALPPENPSGVYGFFGYSGAMCQAALSRDNAPMLKACIDRGFIDKNCEMLDGRNVVTWCRDKGKTACADLLESMP